MATRINPPIFNKAKNYERFSQELLAWRKIIDLKEDKQGIAIALTLPEDDEFQIREKGFDQVPIDDLKSKDRLNVVLIFLDQHLAKDNLTGSLERFEDLMIFVDLRDNLLQNIYLYLTLNTRKSKRKI